MKLKPWQFRWMMNAYPPLFLNGIKIVSLSSDYKSLTVRIRKGVLNRNLQGSIFGGALFSAFDPFYPVMLWQILAHHGIKTQAWLRAAEINYLLPAKSTLLIQFNWHEEAVIEAIEQINRNGKYKGWCTAEAVDSEGVICATCKLLVVLKSHEKVNIQPGF